MPPARSPLSRAALGLLLALALAGAACGPGLAARIPAEDTPLAESPSCDPEVARERLRASSTRIETRETSGTAFHVGDGLYLTAAHVVEGYQQVTLHRGVQEFPGAVVMLDARLDVAAVRSDLVLANTLEFLDDPVGGGDDVWSYGFSERRGIERSLHYIEPSAQWAHVIAMAFEEAPLREDEIAIFSGRLAPGDSGSAVVSACGEVIALATSIIEPLLIRDRLAIGVSAAALEGVAALAASATPVAVATAAIPSEPEPQTPPRPGRYQGYLLDEWSWSVCADTEDEGPASASHPVIIEVYEGGDALIYVEEDLDESWGAVDADGILYAEGITWDESWSIGVRTDGLGRFVNLYLAGNGCAVEVRGAVQVDYLPW